MQTFNMQREIRFGLELVPAMVALILPHIQQQVLLGHVQLQPPFIFTPVRAHFAAVRSLSGGVPGLMLAQRRLVPARKLTEAAFVGLLICVDVHVALENSTSVKCPVAFVTFEIPFPCVNHLMAQQMPLRFE